LTTFSPEFLPSAKNEWDKLGANVREQFARKLRERLMAPHVPSARLSDMPDNTRSSCAPPAIALSIGWMMTGWW
jgi:mRNA-degrading endonuclease RelE of RelBE toxin-antitoxin system